MGKRYYCDYCDRSFKDVQGVRKKHLIGIQHMKNKEEHYKQFKEPEKILEEEKSKKTCIRFLNNGECPFESTCRYSHYTPPMMQQLQFVVAERARMKQQVFNPDPSEIVRRYFEDTVDPEEIEKEEVELWPLPEELKNDPDLPPSLRPMKVKDFVHSDFPEWGWRY